MSSGRRRHSDEQPVKGMSTARMIEYIDHIAQYIEEPSLLIMDRLSSHKAAAVRQHLDSKRTAAGEALIIPILLPPKTAFLISPLDMGAIAAFKSHFYKLDRSTLEHKKRAVQQAWDRVSNDALRNIFQNCGLIGEEPFDSMRLRFRKGVVGAVPAELEEALDFHDSWKSGAINVAGASRGRGVTLEIPQQLSQAHLDGRYWSRYGWLQ